MITTFRPYAIIDASAKMPARVRSPYRHAAICKTDGARWPHNVRGGNDSTVVEYSGKLHAGGKHRDAFHDWLHDAAKRVKELNDAYEIELMIGLGCAQWNIDQITQSRNP